MSFMEVLDERRPSGAHLSIWQDDDFVDLDWDDWRRATERSAAGLWALGVRSQSRVACILTNGPATCTGALGVWLAGGCIVSLPTISRGMPPAEYAATIARICETVGAQLLLVEDRFATQLQDVAPPGMPIASFESLPRDGTSCPARPGDDEVAFIQYSSGSTRTPKGCLLTGRAIDQQLDMLAARLELEGADDRGVSWLPLSHDMGFFGCLLLSFAKGMRLRLGTPERFLRSPRSWFEDCGRWQATITAGPSSGLDIAARACAGAPPTPFPMRKLVVGGERVELHDLGKAVAALEPCGLSWDDLLPAYGLAEAVLAVTMSTVGDAPRVLQLSTEALLNGEIELVDGGDRRQLTPCVSLGSPVGDTTVSIDGGGLGEVQVMSRSLASGYAGEKELTQARFGPGGLRSGDLGFLDQGELFVVGRSDDMICFGGRNVFARDVEASLGDIPGVRRGTPVLLEVFHGGRNRVVVLAELDGCVHGYEALAEELRRTAVRVGGLAPSQCLFVRAGTIPKTPSGKVQRFRCRRLAAEGGSAVVARVSC